MEVESIVGTIEERSARGKKKKYSFEIHILSKRIQFSFSKISLFVIHTFFKIVQIFSSGPSPDKIRS